MTTVVNTTVLFGYRPASNISTLGTAYTARTLLTPWPVLLSGLLISLAVTIAGVYTSYRKTSNPKISRSSVVIIHISTAISAIRAISAIVTSGIAAHNGLNGRSQSVEGLTILVVSIIPSLVPEHEWDIYRVFLAMFSMLCAFLAALISFGNAFFNQNFYGAVWVIGGNCARQTTCGGWYDDFSCGYGYGPLTNFSSNTLKLQYIVKRSDALDTLELYSLAILVITMVAWIFGLCMGGKDLPGRAQPSSSEERSKWESSVKKAAKYKFYFLCAVVGIIALTTLVSVPVYAAAQKSGSGIEGSDVGIFANGTLACESFDLRRPSDKYGFVEEWWKFHRQNMIAVFPLS